MVKKIDIPNVIFDDLELISKELTLIAKKPISHAMTISLLIGVYRAHLSDPCARDAFRQRISILDFLSPEEFEKVWDKQENK
jgi:hypothetical protein